MSESLGCGWIKGVGSGRHWCSVGVLVGVWEVSLLLVLPWCSIRASSQARPRKSYCRDESVMRYEMK